MAALNLMQLSLSRDQVQVIVPGETLPQPQTTADAAAQLGSSITALVEDSHEPEYAEEVRRISYEGGFEKGILVVFQGNSLDNCHRADLFKVLGVDGCQ